MAAGAALLVLAFAPGAHAATVSHFQVNSMSLVEGDAGTSNLTFTISYTGAKNDISVDWATADGTAIAGSDYVASSGTATFTLAGPTSQTITIPVIGDLLDEANETFTVNLTNPQPPATADITDGNRDRHDHRQRPLALGRDQRRLAHRGQRRDDERRLHRHAVGPERAERHGRTTPRPTAPRPSPPTTPTTSGTLTFTPGQVTKTVTVPVVGDTIDENDETFVVNLTVPVERDDRRQPGRRDDHRRRPAALDHDQRRHPHRGQHRHGER